MNTGTKPSSKSRRPQKISGSLFEQVKGFGKQAVRTITSEAGAMAQDGLQSITGGVTSPYETSRLPFSPERYSSPWKKKEKPREFNIFLFKERQDQLQVKEAIEKLVKEIRHEILFIEKQQKNIITQASKITVENLPSTPGVYHIRFFEWLLSLLRDIRKKVNESGNWLAVARGKQKKMGFWTMAKKKGTSFTLSGERAVATQTG